MSSSLVHFIAGATGGLVSFAVTYPLYSITVVQQAQSQAKDPSNPTVNVKPPSSMAVLKGLLQEKGLAGIYAGIQSALVATTFQSGIYYYFFNWFKLFHKVGQEVLWNLILGAEAGACAAVCSTPLWVINTRQITASKEQKRSVSWLEAIRDIYREHGLGGFFHGLLPGLLLVWNPAVQFASYAMLQNWVRQLHGLAPTAALSAIEVFFLSAISKVISTIVTYPLQTIKVAMQKAPSAAPSTAAPAPAPAPDSAQTPAAPAPAAPRSLSFLAAISALYREGGLGTFFRGLNSKLLQTALTQAILFVVRDWTLDVAEKLVGSAPAPAATPASASAPAPAASPKEDDLPLPLFHEEL